MLEMCKLASLNFATIKLRIYWAMTDGNKLKKYISKQCVRMCRVLRCNICKFYFFLTACSPIILHCTHELFKVVCLQRTDFIPDWHILCGLKNVNKTLNLINVFIILCRTFRIYDDDRNKMLNLEEFIEGVHDYGLDYDKEVRCCPLDAILFLHPGRHIPVRSILMVEPDLWSIR